MNEIINEIQKGLSEGDAQWVKEKTEEALKHQVDPKEILQEGLIAPMQVIGKKFRMGDYFIPDVLMCSRAMHAGIYCLKPILGKASKAANGTIVIGTVAGDLHDIGKNMVAMVLEGYGYTVIDIGIDIPSSGFVEAVYQYKPDILALSALLTTTISEQGEVIKKLKEAGIRDQVKVMVGGGPVSKEFAMAIGADGYGHDILEIVEATNSLMNNR